MANWRSCPTPPAPFLQCTVWRSLCMAARSPMGGMGVVVVHALALELRVGCPTTSTSARGQPSANGVAQRRVVDQGREHLRPGPAQQWQGTRLPRPNGASRPCHVSTSTPIIHARRLRQRRADARRGPPRSAGPLPRTLLSKGVWIYYCQTRHASDSTMVRFLNSGIRALGLQPPSSAMWAFLRFPGPLRSHPASQKLMLQL